MSELELSGCGACSENLFQISPSILQHFRIPNIAQEFFTQTRREAVKNSTRQLIPGREVSVCRIGCCVICSIDIAPVSVPEQVLVHLVRPRRVVVSIELLCQKRASHSSIHYVFPVLHGRFSFQAKSVVEVLNPRALIPCKKNSV